WTREGYSGGSSIPAPRIKCYLFILFRSFFFFGAKFLLGFNLPFTINLGRDMR
ncbi:unnamed protein product, partial [Prunus brigantina]